jgi:hypothetical protein
MKRHLIAIGVGTLPALIGLAVVATAVAVEAAAVRVHPRP